jgi:hypothetical protein
MTLIARPIHDSSDRNAHRSDFELFEDDVAIGRIGQTPDRENPVWFWCLYGRAKDGLPPSGLADSLAEAQEQFKAALYAISHKSVQGRSRR